MFFTAGQQSVLLWHAGFTEVTRNTDYSAFACCALGIESASYPANWFLRFHSQASKERCDRHGICLCCRSRPKSDGSSSALRIAYLVSTTKRVYRRRYEILLPPPCMRVYYDLVHLHTRG